MPGTNLTLAPFSSASTSFTADLTNPGMSSESGRKRNEPESHSTRWANLVAPLNTCGLRGGCSERGSNRIGSFHQTAHELSPPKSVTMTPFERTYLATGSMFELYTS